MAAIAVTVLLTTTICIAGTALLSMALAQWLNAGAMSVLSLVAYGLFEWITRQLDFPEQTFVNPYVLIPGIIGGLLTAWLILSPLCADAGLR